MFAFLTRIFPAASSTTGKDPGPVVLQQLWDRKVHCKLPNDNSLKQKSLWVMELDNTCCSIMLWVQPHPRAAGAVGAAP